MKTKENKSEEKKESLFKRIINKLANISNYYLDITFTLNLINNEWYIIPTISLEKLCEHFYITILILNCSLCISFTIVDYREE